MDGMTIDPLLPLDYLVPLGAALLAGVAWISWKTSALCGDRLRAALAAARVLGVAGLLLVALNPGRWQHDRAERETEWAILVDRSLSMTVADADGRTRWDQAVTLARKAATVAQTPVAVHPFSDDLETAVRPDDLPALKPDGARTDVLQAGSSTLARSGSRVLNGMLILSDGGQTSGSESANLTVRALAAGVPIHVVPLGARLSRKNLSLTTRGAMPVAFAGQHLRVAATVRNENLGAISPEIELLDGAGKRLASRKINLADNTASDVEFEVTPDRSGLIDYRLRTPVWPGEQIERDNQAVCAVNVLGGKLRVFIAEGVPYWDSKFLVQLLRVQSNYEVTSVYRLAGERFFKLETDVSKAEAAGRHTFPDDPEKLNRFDAVIFGKGAEYFLTPARIELLRKFVRDRGGAVIFARGKPYTGTFPDLEPMEPVEWGEAIGGEFKFRPTVLGNAAGLFGTLLPSAGDSKWQAIPPLQNASAVRLKAFSTALAEGVSDAGGHRTFPAVISRRFGNGTIAAVNADGLWTWDFFPSSSATSETYKAFWPQLVQWSCTAGDFLPGENYSLRLSETRVVAGTPVRAHVRSRVSPANGAAPWVRVASGTTVSLVAAVRSPDEPDGWSALLNVARPGTYRAEVLESVAAAAPAPAASCRLTVDPPPCDQDDLSANPGFLEKLAKGSGGSVLSEADLARTLIPRTFHEPDYGKAHWIPFWDRSWCLLAIAGCFAAEWFFRRRSGLV